MSKSSQDGWVRLGCCGRPHGLGGEVWFTADNAESETLRPGLALRLEAEDGEVRVVRVTDLRPSSGRFVIRLQGVDDRTSAEGINRWVASARRSDFPEPDDGEFYHVDLIGLEARGPEGEAIGEVTGVLRSPAHDLLVVGEGDDELLVPLVTDWIQRVDLDQGVVELARSEGLDS